MALTLLQDGTLVSGSWDKTIKFWNVNNGQCIKTLNGHTDWVNCLLLLKNGQLASGSWIKQLKYGIQIRVNALKHL
jgi:WD40 repeat protein